MFVRAKRDFDCPSHKMTKGAEADLQESIALAAIERGDAEAIDQRTAIKKVADLMTRGESGLRTKRNRRNSGDDLPDKSE